VSEVRITGRRQEFVKDDDQFDVGDQFDMGDQGSRDGGNKPAWFGPKKFGVGYGPRTWQGYLVTAGVALFALLIGTVTKGHHHHSSLILLAIIPAVAIPLIIRVIQRR
jgi:hypothetical protein